VCLVVVLIGHSERRIMHNETDKIIAEKFCMIKKLNLIPILCIGEFEKQKYKKTEKFLENQLTHIFDILGKTAFRNTVIAYEPIWAIGKGISADPENVQFIHCFIRNYISQHDIISAKNLMIQYGGSINQENAKMFFKQKDINGLLVGSASLIHETFIKIIEASNVII
jgi:triosephosphate isomerase